jgi:hypothetical protein
MLSSDTLLDGIFTYHLHIVYRTENIYATSKSNFSNKVIVILITVDINCCLMKLLFIIMFENVNIDIRCLRILDFAQKYFFLINYLNNCKQFCVSTRIF